MIRKIELGKKHEPFAEPTPLGLIGLAVGCAALLPIALGYTKSAEALRTAAMFCLLFGAGGQFLAGMMNFANKNLFGGTIFTAFSLNWAMNWWSLTQVASGSIPDHDVVLAVDGLFLVIFLVLTYGFGFFSSLLFVFLLDIDLLYACRLIAAITGTRALALPIAGLTGALAVISLWLAFAGLINPTAGRPIFPVPGPMFLPPKKETFDWSVRNAMFEILFKHWSVHAFKTMGFEELREKMKEKIGDRNILPDLAYLMETGAVVVTTENDQFVNIRLSAEGIDIYEQLILKKYDF